MFKILNKYILNFRYAFRPRKPLLVSRLISTYLKILFFKARPLRYVDFAIGFRCNLNCRHCFAAALKKDAQMISPKQFGKVAKEAMKLGAVNFSFQGGEPLLYDNLCEYIKAAMPEKNLISVTTNGTLLTEKKIKELKDLGVDILTVSLDSGIAGEHDEFRGREGGFQQILEGIRLALLHGLNVTVGCVITSDSLRSKGLEELINLTKELKVILFLILPVPIGRWQEQKNILLSSSDLIYLKEILKKHRHIRTDFDANYIRRGCGAAKEILYITPYGDVLVCPFIHISFGNIQRDNLRIIRNRTLKIDCLAKYHNKCLCGEDREFIEKYLYKVAAFNEKPVFYKEIFI